MLPGGLCANKVKIVITLNERTHYQKNFFEKIFPLNKMRLFRIFQGLQKGDFMLACFPYIPFFGTTPVLLRPYETHLTGVFYL